MTSTETIRAWKDPYLRPESVGEHPAGDISLPAVGGEAGSHWECISYYVISCFPTCDETLWDGTCNVASIGCCPTCRPDIPECAGDGCNGVAA